MKEQIIKGAQIFAKKVNKNSPLLLTIGTCFGVGCVIVTTIKATRKYDSETEQKSYEYEDQQVPTKEKVKIAAKSYWPVALSAGGTVAMTVANHKITSDRIHTATVAYEFYKDAYQTYREKVKERLGKDEARITEADIAGEKLREHHPDYYADPSLIPGEGVIFIESLSGQPFRASIEDIYKEAARFNDDLRGSDWLSINEWLCHLGLNEMSHDIGENLGWVEKYDHDGLNIMLTPSDKIFATGETATVIEYEDNLVSWNDYECINS